MSVVNLFRRPVTNGKETVPVAVLFDFGGTLDANGVAWKERFFRLYRDEGVGISPERFDQVFYAADDALVGAIPPTLPLRDTVGRLVEGVTTTLGLRDHGIGERITTRFLAETRDQLSINAALLDRLSRRYRLGVVSNFYGNLVSVCHEAGLTSYFTVVVDSAHVGFAKPDPRIFFRALAEVRADPAQAVFVGDSVRRDMAGARAIGMPHIWLTPAPSQNEGPCCPDDGVVHTLDEMVGWLL